MYKIYIFMQCAPDPNEFFQSIFGLRADVGICRLTANPNTPLSEAEIEYATGVYIIVAIIAIITPGHPSCNCA